MSHGRPPICLRDISTPRGEAVPLAATAPRPPALGPGCGLSLWTDPAGHFLPVDVQFVASVWLLSAARCFQDPSAFPPQHVIPFLPERCPLLGTVCSPSPLTAFAPSGYREVWALKILYVCTPGTWSWSSALGSGLGCPFPVLLEYCLGAAGGCLPLGLPLRAPASTDISARLSG